MQKLYIIVLSSLALTLAMPHPENKQPTRNIDWDIKDPGILSVKHTQELYNDGGRQVLGTGSVSKNFVDKNAPTSVGGEVRYNNLNSGNSFGLTAENRERFGTKVGAEATYNVFKDRFNKFDVGLSYDQKFGGLGGRSEPMFGAFGRVTF